MSFLSISFAVTALASSAWAKPIAQAASGTCAPLEVGSGPVPSPDTADAFASLQAFADISKAATVPDNYVNGFVNMDFYPADQKQLVASITLASYDTIQCAQACTNTDTCNAITIFFERDPKLEPGQDCPDPPSTTIIKCKMWAISDFEGMYREYGQDIGSFNVVVAGANGYVHKVSGDVPVFAGFNVEVYEAATIDAPLDCYGNDTYLGSNYWHDAHFDVNRCVAGCNAITNDPSNPSNCVFINTYVQRRATIPYSQHCSYYSAYWPKKYATNTGQYRGADLVDLETTLSYGFVLNDKDYSACFPSEAPVAGTPSPGDNDSDSIPNSEEPPTVTAF